MVGPRREPGTNYFDRKFQIGTVLLVGGSAVTTALYGGATLTQSALVGAAGLVAGVAILLALGLRPWE